MIFLIFDKKCPRNQTFISLELRWQRSRSFGEKKEKFILQAFMRPQALRCRIDLQKHVGRGRQHRFSTGDASNAATEKLCRVDRERIEFISVRHGNSGRSACQAVVSNKFSLCRGDAETRKSGKNKNFPKNFFAPIFSV